MGHVVSWGMLSWGILSWGMSSYGACRLWGILSMGHVVSWGMMSMGQVVLGHSVLGHSVSGHSVLGHVVLGHHVWTPGRAIKRGSYPRGIISEFRKWQTTAWNERKCIWAGWGLGKIITRLNRLFTLYRPLHSVQCESFVFHHIETQIIFENGLINRKY